VSGKGAFLGHADHDSRAVRISLPVAQVPPEPEQLDLLSAIAEEEEGFADWDIFGPADDDEDEAA
jgi:hypothetical protein